VEGKGYGGVSCEPEVIWENEICRESDTVE
jgi:hypothetical protein